MCHSWQELAGSRSATHSVVDFTRLSGRYILSEQSERQLGVHRTTDDVADAGDSGGEGQRVKMISDSQVHILNAGESVVLECYFNAAQYNMFDYPLLWKKVLSTPLLL